MAAALQPDPQYLSLHPPVLLQLSLGGSGGRVVDGGGGVGEILPKSLRGEIAISDIEVVGESTGGGKGPHFIFRHFTKLERS